MIRLSLFLRLSFVLCLCSLYSSVLSAFTVSTKEGESLKFDALKLSSPYFIGKFHGQNISLPVADLHRIDSKGNKFWVYLRSDEKLLAKEVTFEDEAVSVILAATGKSIDLDLYSIDFFETKVTKTSVTKTSERSLSDVKLDLQKHKKLTAVEQQISDRTVVGEVGQANYSVSAAYYTGKDYSNVTNTSEIVSASAGVVLKLPVRLYAYANTSYSRNEMEISYNNQIYKIKKDGFSSATFGIRGVVLSETYNLPEISLSPRYVKSLTSDSFLGRTYDTVGLGVSLVKTADPVVCFARLSSLWKINELDDTPKRLGFELGAAVAFNEQISLMGSIGLVDYPNSTSIDDQYGVINCGINYRITDRIYLENNMQLELDEEQPDLMFSFGITYR